MRMAPQEAGEARAAGEAAAVAVYVARRPRSGQWPVGEVVVPGDR